MNISFVVAVADNGAIGIKNQLPWHLPEDLKFFKKTTYGKPIVMGRKTFESIGKALPGRLNVVISMQKNLPLPEGVVLFNDLQNAMHWLEHQGNEEVFIIGGAKLFETALPLADTLYITRVHTVIDDADVFLPHIDHSHWKLNWQEAHNADEKHKFAFTFQKHERISF